MNAKQGGLSPTANVANSNTYVDANLEQLDMVAEDDQTTFAQLVDTNEFINRQFKETHVKNNTLQEIITTVGGSRSPTQSAYEVDHKSKKRTAWIK